jgi:hypothetical protein
LNRQRVKEARIESISDYQPDKPVTYTRCMTSHCDLADACARHEDDAGRHLLTRTYADFSEELIRKPDHTTTCPFSSTGMTWSRLHINLCSLPNRRADRICLSW